MRAQPVVDLVALGVFRRSANRTDIKPNVARITQRKQRSFSCCLSASLQVHADDSIDQIAARGVVHSHGIVWVIADDRIFEAGNFGSPVRDERDALPDLVERLIDDSLDLLTALAPTNVVAYEYGRYGRPKKWDAVEEPNLAQRIELSDDGAILNRERLRVPLAIFVVCEEPGPRFVLVGHRQPDSNRRRQLAIDVEVPAPGEPVLFNTLGQGLNVLCRVQNAHCDLSAYLRSARRHHNRRAVRGCRRAAVRAHLARLVRRVLARLCGLLGPLRRHSNQTAAQPLAGAVVNQPPRQEAVGGKDVVGPALFTAHILAPSRAEAETDPSQLAVVVNLGAGDDPSAHAFR